MVIMALATTSCLGLVQVEAGEVGAVLVAILFVMKQTRNTEPLVVVLEVRPLLPSLPNILHIHFTAKYYILYVSKRRNAEIGLKRRLLRTAYFEGKRTTVNVCEPFKGVWR